MSETAATRKQDILSTGQASSPGDLQPSADIVDYVKEYAREKPEVAALWCLGIGFVLGWKLKPW
ncbi:hypothetical protein [Adhaeretor mobilis]|uniref:Uncharacterized protein n=1 Tax=Adhaeretor mobilis TaxID=1930276 RepID=A0A517N1V3_9BACT|nr:hypothetical protein [Adhaeretor mobilis]QDT01103.1 hypothetical protein HG15A2_44450 [Adhaeretor mobilis]